MGNYFLKGAEGSISIRDIEYQEGALNYSNNTLLWVHIKSGPFSGATRIDVSVDDMKEFSDNMMKMYESLEGEAFIKEVYGESYIKMTCTKGGHINVQGILIDEDSSQKLRFNFIIDQTMLRKFALKMYENYVGTEDIVNIN